MSARIGGSNRIISLQLARHSDQCAKNTVRLHFENYVYFAMRNQHLIKQHGSGHYLLALDASYLPKSGKATPGVGKYYGADFYDSCKRVD